MIKTTLLCISILFMFSCATKIKTAVTLPARSADATKVTVVALLPFTGYNSKNYTRDAETVLKNVKVNGQYYFTLIDRHNIDKVIAEQNFQLNVADQSTFVKLGKIIGAEGIYTGAIDAHIADSSYTASRSRCQTKDKKGKCKKYYSYKIPCTKRIATFKFQPKLIDVSTTKILLAQTYETKTSSSRCQDSSYGLKSKKELIDTASIYAFAMFRKDIAPYSQTISIELMDDTDNLTKKEKQIFEGAIEFAEAGRMDRSCELWNGITNKSSIALIHNIGLCSEISGNIEDAEKHYRAADRMLIKPDDTINASLARIIKMKDDQRKLKEQLH